MMKSLAILLCVMVLSGCSSLDGKLTNEVVCAEGGKLRYISFYGPIGVATKVDSSVVQCPKV